MVLRYQCASKDAVKANFAKEGVLISFRTVDGVWYSLAVRTYAPLTPGWCHVSVKQSDIVVMIAKAKPEPWGCVGELCSAADAGLALEAEEAEAAYIAEGEDVKKKTAQGCDAECARSEGAEEGSTARHEVPREFVHKLDFIPAACFEGSKAGYVFQLGADG